MRASLDAAIVAPCRYNGRMTLMLQPHSTTPSRAIRRIDVTVERDDALLLFDYTLYGDIDAIVVPPLATPARRDELWRHTCCEAFLGTDGTEYCEFNFAPSGCWAAYRFDDYRRGMHELITDSPRIAIVATTQTLHVKATLKLTASPRRLGLACVIEERDGALSYWALAHHADKPDFHDRNTWLAM